MRIFAFVAAVSLLGASAFAQDAGYNPNKVFVPDAKTAIAIGRAVLAPIYGSENMQREEPLIAKRRGDIWTVSGTLNCGMSRLQKMMGGSCVGGAAEIRLSAKDGRVLHVTHYQ